MKRIYQGILIGLTVMFGSCSGNSEQSDFYYATNYFSVTPVGDSIFIAGTKTDPGIKSKGWALYQSISGAWGFSIGDGKTGFLYQPTPERQSVTDGKKRGLAFAFDTISMEIRMWFDGKNVAIYNVSGLDLSKMDLGKGTNFRNPIVPYNSVPPDTIRVMAWNIWHGGRESGITEGVARVVDIIKKSKADIICMVETYGSGPIIADSLGYYFYLRSSNLSIMSKFPIGETIDMFRPFNYGGAEILLTEEVKIRVHPLWIHYLPDMNNLRNTNIPIDSLIKWEWQTRGSEIQEILKQMNSEIKESEDVPVIMAGDYNSPSHFDWGELTARMHDDRIIEWPVSSQMEGAGMIDAYRYVHPDPLAYPGKTWSPIFKKAWQDRIDYVYFKGSNLVPISAEVVNTYIDIFPSDHAAVLVGFLWR
ncbi:MAG: endonuclease/exonuclease/phosphatase family protein [Bacteroidota bacterium]|nr:endonuclease/exonuclease/phosphatase family protein [Bacteroidota bacterium]